MIKAQSKCVWKAKPFKVLTQEITTRVRPAEKSFSPSSTTAFSNVGPWLLCIVVPQANIRGSWVWVRAFHALVSHCAITGTVGTQDGSIPSQFWRDDFVGYMVYWVPVYLHDLQFSVCGGNAIFWKNEFSLT